MFLEDGEFNNAGRYLNQALNQYAENARVYLDQLMLEYEAHSTSELIDKLSKPIEEEKLFQRALRFADDDYKKQLEDLTQANRDKLEQNSQAKEATEIAKKEERYQEILKAKEKAMTTDELSALMNEIRAIMSYKNSKELYEEVLTTWKNEKKYKSALITKKYASTLDNFRQLISELEELAKLKYKNSDELLAEARKSLTEAEQAEQRKHNMKIVLVVASIGGIFWYQIYSAPQEKQRIQHEAETQLEAHQLYAEALRVEAQREEEARRREEPRRQIYGSDYAKGEDYLNENNYSRAFEIFLRLANDGYAPAQDKLAWMYQNGWGVEQSYTQAVTWFRRAAEQGNTEAMASMGLMYYRGWGVPQNYDTALEWYGKAANQGSEVAQRLINSIQLLKDNIAKIASIRNGTGFPIPGTIFADTLSVREFPSTNSTRIKTLKTGHPVSISRTSESDGDYWFLVKTASGTEGWVSGKYIRLRD